MTMRVLQVCVGPARPVRINGRTVVTAIGKSAVTEPVALRMLGLDGDTQADQTVHGGLSKAVYAYPSEHLPFWQAVRAQARAALWGDALAPGAFGENLLLHGVLESNLFIGDRLVLPGCVLAVSEPRMPCFKFNAAMGFPHAAKMMVQSGFCGSYLAVVEPGQVQAGDAIRLVPGPRQVGISELFRARARS